MDKKVKVPRPAMTIRCEVYNRIDYTPGLKLALRAQLELLDADRMPAEVCIYWDDHCIVAFNPDNIPIGVITYKYLEYACTVHITIGYVSFGWRRMGVYKAMWERLIAEARKLGALKITGVTSNDNEPMLKCAHSLGREKEATILNYFLPYHEG